MASLPGPDRAFFRELAGFIAKSRRGWVLVPEPSPQPLALSASKFGGVPHPAGREVWPKCPRCRVPLNFVLQLHRRQFSRMWFPKTKNLFQLFRCPNAYCKASKRRADRFMLAGFQRTLPGKHAPLVRPVVDLKSRFQYYEEQIAEHGFCVVHVNDYPSSCIEALEDWWGDGWSKFQEKYTRFPDYNPFVNDWFYEGEFWSQIENKVGIKVAGLPSWQQGGSPPKCRCGQVKEFIFQLASVYGNLGDHAEISIGDAGNIYYFVCKVCGEDSLESFWDCG